MVGINGKRGLAYREERKDKPRCGKSEWEIGHVVKGYISRLFQDCDKHRLKEEEVVSNRYLQLSPPPTKRSAA